MISAALKFLSKYSRKFKDHPLFVGWVFHVPIVIISTAEATEFVLGSTTEIEKSRFYDLLHDWLGTGLLTR